jgi:adenine phosphoribosyltransferase
VDSDLVELIRSIPDFPKPGILFRDITTLLNDAGGFRRAIETLCQRYRSENLDKIVCIEARGFLIGAPMAFDLGCALVPVRKPGKLPGDTVSAEYELEYGTDSVEMHSDAIERGDRVLMVDDLLATGGTARATAELVDRLGGEIVGCAFLIELVPLQGRKLLDKYDVFSVISYE